MVGLGYIVNNIRSRLCMHFYCDAVVCVSKPLVNVTRTSAAGRAYTRNMTKQCNYGFVYRQALIVDI